MESQNSNVVSCISSGGLSYGNGYAISSETPGHLEGKLLTILETAGLPEKQEQALKGLIRRAIWEVIDDSVYLSSKRYTEIRELYWEMKKKAGANGLPLSEI